MARKPITYQNDIQTQVHSITSSTKEDKKEQEEKQHGTQTPNRNKRSFENVLDPQHPFFEVFGLPFINHIESTHKKSRTYYKFKEQDPMYGICGDMNEATSEETNEETDEETDQEKTNRQREKVNNDIQISGKLFKKAIQSIKNN